MQEPPTIADSIAQNYIYAMTLHCGSPVCDHKRTFSLTELPAKATVKNLERRPCSVCGERCTQVEPRWRSDFASGMGRVVVYPADEEPDV